MTTYSKSVDGLDELISAFMKLPDDALKYLQDAANDAGNVVLNKTKQNVPEGTGQLKSKLKLGKAKKSSKYPYRVFSKVTFPNSVAHGVPLELGHKLVKNGNTYGAVSERPFLRPAADESGDDVTQRIADAMNKALENMGGKR